MARIHVNIGLIGKAISTIALDQWVVYVEFNPLAAAIAIELGCVEFAFIQIFIASRHAAADIAC